MTPTPPPPAGNYCEQHRKGGIQSSTVSAKPCDVCGETPTKAGFAAGDEKRMMEEYLASLDREAQSLGVITEALMDTISMQDKTVKIHIKMIRQMRDELDTYARRNHCWLCRLFAATRSSPHR